MYELVYDVATIIYPFSLLKAPGKLQIAVSRALLIFQNKNSNAVSNQLKGNTHQIINVYQ